MTVHWNICNKPWIFIVKNLVIIIPILQAVFMKLAWFSRAKVTTTAPWSIYNKLWGFNEKTLGFDIPILPVV